MGGPVGRRREPMKPHRRILCVFPRYARSFGTLHHAYPLMPRVRAFMPPQGLLLIAASIPPEWEVRFVDENMSPARREDFVWAGAGAGQGHGARRPLGLGLSRVVSGFRLPPHRRAGRRDAGALRPPR